MNKTLGILYAFLGGAVVGCATALLFAPEKGEDLRTRIKELLKKKGIDSATTRLNNSSSRSAPRLRNNQ